MSKTVLVTGASTGIGRAAALLLMSTLGRVLPQYTLDAVRLRALGLS
ncbi:hypothetical protein IU459_31175 [Nocardia amamiensis]|uniref:Short-chain dehydrogenase n=1 Tax=Nocardia amamiensis TaxID=404578 RepID=A0ABS0CZZ6_9NOCA|nr:hypothetical protein [Nocardia amamiensis]MBF6301976.1 hypothetical protein [Nocardia amamiensis]